MTVETGHQDLADWIKQADQRVVAEVLAACAPELIHDLAFWMAYGQDEEIRPHPDRLADFADAWRAEMDRRTDGYVYVLAGGGFHKIGRAKKPIERARTLAIQLPYEVDTVHVAASDDYVEAERVLHGLFAGSRVNGEWFELSESDLEMLAYLLNLGRFDRWQMEGWYA